MKRTAKRPVAKKPRRRPQPVTRLKLKQLNATQVELLREAFSCVGPDQWRLVADARGKSIKLKPPRGAPVARMATQDAGSTGTVVVLFAVARRTDIVADG